MKSYKDFEKRFIGESDIASLTMVGFKEGAGVIPEMLRFGKDDAYNAYIVSGEDVEIPDHYEDVSRFESWMKIYDDKELTFRAEGKQIIIYRSGLMGCIIQVIN